METESKKTIAQQLAEENKRLQAENDALKNSGVVAPLISFKGQSFKLEAQRFIFDGQTIEAKALLENPEKYSEVIEKLISTNSSILFAV